jgi:hypothetical protein
VYSRLARGSYGIDWLEVVKLLIGSHACWLYGQPACTDFEQDSRVDLSTEFYM